MASLSFIGKDTFIDMPTVTLPHEERMQAKQGTMHWPLWAQQHGYALVERKALVRNERLAFLEIWGLPRVRRERFLFYLPEPVASTPLTMLYIITDEGHFAELHNFWLQLVQREAA